MQFDWDEANTSHLSRHRVSRMDAEEALGDPFGQMLDCSFEDEEVRYKQIGSTLGGRLLIVCFRMREDLYRPITAFDAPSVEAREYRHGGN